LDIDLAFVLVQSKHDLNGKDQLLYLIRKYPEGLPVVEVKDAYPTVLEDLQVTTLFLL
jgi:transcription initiation factor TFIIE subunit beta